MAAATCGWLISGFSSPFRHVTGYNLLPITFVQARNYAARKGTREKARKKKVKVIIEKVGFIPHNLRQARHIAAKNKKATQDIILDDSKKTEPIDNVWIGFFHKWKIYPFDEAKQCHRETHHPTIYNLPNASINAFIELDMQIKAAHDNRIKCITHINNLLVSASSSGEIKVWKYNRHSLDILQTVDCGTRITCLTLALPCESIVQQNRLSWKKRRK